jgi:hypothetical protein
MNLKAMVKKGQDQLPPRIMIVGVESVGKSTLGNRTPSPLFICSENGLVGPEFANTPNVTPANWSDVIGTVDSLMTDEHPYKTVVFDTVDWMEPLLYAHLCRRDGKNDIEAYGYGKGYVLAGIEWRAFLGRLENLRAKKKMGIIFLAHCAIKTFNNPTGDNYDRYQTKMSKEISAITREWCDAVLFAAFENFVNKEGAKGKAVTSGARVVYTTHNPAWDAKNRYGMPERLPLDWEAISAAISGGAVKPEDVITEIETIMAGSSVFTDDDKVKVKSAIEKNKTNQTTLAQILNKVRVKGGK